MCDIGGLKHTWLLGSFGPEATLLPQSKCFMRTEQIASWSKLLRPERKFWLHFLSQELKEKLSRVVQDDDSSFGISVIRDGTFNVKECGEWWKASHVPPLMEISRWPVFHNKYAITKIPPLYRGYMSVRAWHNSGKLRAHPDDDEAGAEFSHNVSQRFMAQHKEAV